MSRINLLAIYIHTLIDRLSTRFRHISSQRGSAKSLGTRKSTKSGSAKSAASSPAKSPIRGGGKKSGAGGAGKKRLRMKPGSLFPADEKIEFYVAPSYVPPTAAPTLSRSNSKTASFAAKANWELTLTGQKRT